MQPPTVPHLLNENVPIFPDSYLKIAESDPWATVVSVTQPFS